MANEFIIKNGFHSKGDSQITGSLTGTSGTLNEFSSSYALTASHALSAPSSPAGNNQEVQFNNSGILAGNSNFKINNSTGIVSMINGAYFNSSNSGIIKYTPATEVLGINADDDSAYVEINGFDGGTKIRIGDDSANDGVQITSSLGGVNIKGSIIGDDQFTLPKLNVSASILNFTNNNYKINATNATSIIFNNDDRSIVTRIKGSDGLGSELQVGDKETLVSGSLHVKGFAITASAGLLLSDASNGNTARANSTNIIQAPNSNPSSGAPGAPVIIKGGNSDGSGAKGGDLYLEGGIPSAGIGGNIYIAGGNGSTSGSVHLKGNKINLDNTALEYYNNASNFYKLLNYNSSDQCAEIGIISYTATGGSARDVKFFADGEEAFKITGGSGQKATLQGSRSGQHTEVRATSGSFSYVRGNSPLVIDTGTDTLKIAASNFSVSTAGEMSSGGSDGISTTSITASSDISSSGTITGNSFVKGGGTSAQFLKADGSVDSSTYSTATGVENNADVTDATNVAAAGALMASNNLSDLGTVSTARTNLGLGSFAEISSLAFSSLTGKPTTVAGYGITDAATATSTTTFSNKSGNISQWTNNSGYLTAFTVQEDGSNVETGTKKLNFTGNAVTAATDGADKVTLTISTGSVSVTGTLPFTGSAGISGSLEIIGSGSGLFKVEGSVGTLFSVDDGLDDVIFAANNVSGTPVISANADNTVKLGKLGGFGIVISGSTPAPTNDAAKIIMTGSLFQKGSTAFFSSSMGVGTSAQGTIGRIDASNDVVAFSTSDERLKDNITPIENALNKVSQVQGIEFDWIEKEGIHGNKGHDIGVIAQEIEKVLPEVVTTRDNGYKAVKYEKIIPLLVEAIKELQAEVQELKNNK